MKTNYFFRRLGVILSFFFMSSMLFGQSVTATFSSGDISTELSSSVTTAITSACADTLDVAVPVGALITGVDVAYSMTSANYAYKSEQKSFIRCITTGGTVEPSYTPGVGGSMGTMTYSRTGLTIANAVVSTGTVQFQMNAFRSWGGSGCSSNYTKVDNNTWVITVHYVFPAALDAGISDVFAGCFGSNIVHAKIKNYGTNTLVSATINYTVNGTAQTAVSWTGSLLTAEEAIVDLGVNPATAGNPASYVVYSTSPNGGTDLDLTNDTSSASIDVAPSIPLLETWDAIALGNVPANGLSNGWSCGQGANPRWVVKSGSTTSSYTGPSSDHTLGNSSGHYVYLETSGGALGSTSYLESPCTDFSAYPAGIKMEFYYHMYGASMGTLGVEEYVNGTWNSVWSISGQQQASSSASWTKKAVSISSNATRIRFAGVRGSSYTGDMSIDDVRFFLPPNNDLAVIDWTSPITVTAPNAAMPITVKVKNMGAVLQDTFAIKYSINAGAIIITENYNDTLLPGDTLVYTFNATANMPAGYYECGAVVKNVGDTFPENDSLSVGVWIGTPLSGTYTIGANTTDDFVSVGQAVDAMQNLGLSGAVIFMVDSGTYNEQVILDGTIAGLSPINTITFKGNGDATVISAVPNSTNRDIFRIDGVSYVTLDSLTILASGSGDYNCGIRVIGADSITIKNCDITVPTNVKSYTNGVLITGATNGYYQGTSANYFTFENNSIHGGNFGIRVVGISSNHSTNTKVSNNTVENFYYHGIEAYYQDSVEIMYNTVISRLNMAGGAGINVNNNYLGSRVAYNIVTMNTLSNGYGLYINSCQGSSATNPYRVYNNMVSFPTATAAATGIVSGYGKNVYFYYNTVNIATGDASSRAMFVSGNATSTNYENIKIKNNIFANYGSGYAINIYGDYYPTKVTECDYNDLYTSGSKFARYGSTDKGGLTAWQSTATGLGANSRTIDPVFNTLTDLHVSSIPLNGLGAPIAGYTDDIDGETRNVSTPDMGADEYTPPANELAIIEWITPLSGVALSPSVTVKVRMVNYGTNSQTNFPIKYSIDGGTTVNTETYTSTIASQDTVEYTFTTPANFNTFGLYHCLAYTDLSNDTNRLNDTTFYDVYACSPFTGAYTLGLDAADDFSTFSELAYALENCGVGGPITVYVDSGMFAERVEFSAVTGASEINTITIKGYGANTIITDTTANSNNKIIFNFDGAKFFVLDSLKIKRSDNANYFWGVHFMNEADSNTVKNCIIDCDTVGTNFMGIIATGSKTSYYTSGNTANGLVIDNNTIIGGGYGMYLKGTSNIVLCGGNQITNNTVSDFSSCGIYVIYQDSIMVSHNMIESGEKTSSGAYGAYLGYGKNKMKFTNNTINMMKGGYGLQLYQHNYNGTGNKAAIVANNFIHYHSVSNYSTRSANYLYYCKNIKFYNNSANITGIGAKTSGIYMYGSSTIDIKNNIFANHANGYAIYSRISKTSFENNYNNLYSSSSKIGYISYSTKYSLAAWQSATSDGANSVSMDPEYLGDINLHTYSVAMSNLGTPLADVTTDIDGDTRSATTPDMGADEYTPLNNNLSTTEVIASVNPWWGSSDSLYVVVKNKGLLTIYNLPVTFSGTTPSGTFNLTGTIDSIHSLEIDTVYMGVFVATDPGMYAGKAYANLITDTFLTDDTTTVSAEIYFPDTTEYFEDFTTSTPVHWDMVGNGTNVWTRFGTTAVKANFYSQSSGKTNEMISPVVALPTNKTAYVGFNYSYKEYSGSVDSLEVYVRNSNTANWTLVWVKGGADLVSGSNSSTLPGVYKDAYVVIPSSMQGDSIRVMFRGISDYGSSLFIDGVAVFFAPEVNIGPDTSICSGNTYTFDAGTFSHADYVWTKGLDTVGTAQTFDATTAGTYVAHVSQYGVTGIDAANFIVHLAPAVSFTGLNASYCNDEMASVLLPTPAGGLFTGNGISGNTFDPVVAGIGNHVVTYTYTTPAGCTSSTTNATDVFEAPVVSLMDTAICEGDSVTFSAGTVVSATPDLIFSMYIEGSSNNKALEVYNATTDTLNLDDYSIVTNYNGNAWSGQYHFPAGTKLNPSDVFVIANQNADSIILSVTDDTLAYNAGGYIVSFNGDDVRALFKHTATDSMMIDIIGRYDLVDPGKGWEVAGVNNATKDHSLVRKSTIVSGNTDWDAIAGTDSVSSEYIVYPKNTFTYLGSHSATAPVPVPYTYLWSNGDTTATITVAPNATTTYSVTVDNGVCSAFDSAVVTVNSIPVVNLGNDTTIMWTYGVVKLDAGNPNASSWNWSTGDIYQKVTFTNANLSNSAPNVISVVVTENGCSASDTIVITANNDVSIDESFANMTVEVYPNPARGQFNLSINGFEGDLDMNIVDLVGQVVYTEKIKVTSNYINKFNVNNLSSGVYYIKLISKDGVKVQKLVIQ